jgi:site-specific recombinase XerC
MAEFIDYCVLHNHLALPANPEVIATFLLGSAQTGIKTSTIRRKVGSISAVHRLSNLGDPTKHPEVKLSLRKIHRQLGRRFNQAYPITRTLLDQLLAVCGNDLHGIRNRALLLFAYDSMRRRSEIVSIRIEDIESLTAKNISLLLRKSKTDQVSSGHWIHLRKESSSAIQSWLKTADIREGFLFRGIASDGQVNSELCDGQVGRMFKSLARKAGLDENAYAKGIKVTDEELATLAIQRDEFHGEWNYRLLPRNQHV